MSNIKDVALRAGVSISTVSIVLNGNASKRKISEDTVNKVMTAVRELGYQPNLSARSLRAPQKKTIALFWTTDFREAMLARFLKGLHQRINEINLDISIVIYTYDNDHLSDYKELESASAFHGAIIANASRKDLEYLSSIEPRVPVVLYNRELEGYASVIVDNRKVGALAGEHLKDRKKIGLLRAPSLFAGMSVREEAFLETVGQVCQIINLPGQDDHLVDAFASSFDPGDLDGLFVPGDHVAYALKYHLEKKNHSSLKIVSVGNGLTMYARWFSDELVHVMIPMEKMAEDCVEVMESLFRGEDPRRVTVDPELKKR